MVDLTMSKKTFSVLGSLLFSSVFLMSAFLSGCNQNQTSSTSKTTTGKVSSEMVSVKPAHAKSEPSSASSTVLNQSSTSYTLSKAEEIIKTSSHGAMVATRVFDAHVPGVTGVVVAPQAELSQAMSIETGAVPSKDGSVQTKIDWNKVHQQIIFLMNGNGDIAPQLIDKDGKLVNDALMIELGLRKSPDEALTEAALPSHHGFILGKKGPILTVFADPNCIWCNKLILELKPHLNAGDLRARIILVGFLKQDSVAKSATILAAKSPSESMLEDENHFDTKNESGGTKPLKNPDPNLLNVVTQNNNLMFSIAQTGTPMMLFCNQKNKVQLFEGMPQDLNGLIAQISDNGNSACK